MMNNVSTGIGRIPLSTFLCIICQTGDDKEEFVRNPDSFNKLLYYIRQRASYNDGNFPQISIRLGDVSEQELKSMRANYHRRCYKNTVHKAMLDRAKLRFDKNATGLHDTESERDGAFSSQILTRSQVAPYNRTSCFFCESSGTHKNPLHSVTSSNAGKALNEAIMLSGNEKLRIKLATASDMNDAHAIDIKYHKKCWLLNVVNVKRQHTSCAPTNKPTGWVAAEIEFLKLVENQLADGSLTNMSTLKDVFDELLRNNGINNPDCDKRKLKLLLQEHVEGIEFHKPKRLNQSDNVTLKKGRDSAVQLLVNSSESCSKDMKILYDAAAILRKSISQLRRWSFQGSFNDTTDEHIPKDLSIFFRWVIQGTRTSLSSDMKDSQINANVMSLVQSTVSMFLSDSQAYNVKSDRYYSRDMPHQIAVGIAMRKLTRSKRIIDMLHRFNVSAEYNKLLRIETQIANSVIMRMESNNGVYIPADFIPGRHIFFAIDNIDFAEDTLNGKDTLHATTMAIYQMCEPDDRPSNLTLSIDAKDRSLTKIPDTITKLLECSKPDQKPNLPVSYPLLNLASNQIVADSCTQEYAWLLSRTLMLSSTDNQTFADEHSNVEIDIPTWSAFSSLVSEQMPQTRVGTSPLIPAPAHEWRTLLTVLKQAQGINTEIVGPNRKTVISLDMGLYKPAKQLQMSRKDLDGIILRAGELHIVIAQLRCIGSFIENSGIDLAWIEAEVYNPSTVKQFIEGRHIRRGLDAHLMMLQALFILYEDFFFSAHPDLHAVFRSLTNELNLACKKQDNDRIKDVHNKLIETFKSQNVLDSMTSFDKQYVLSPVSRMAMQYMKMVIIMFNFIRSVRSGDWEMHLTSLKQFTQYFFSHDRLVYSRMIPLYLADMRLLETSHPIVHQEFMRGNWVVNKNKYVPFCAIGADHALEHINRSMKVSGGLVGITQNKSARTRYAIISPELTKLTEEAEKTIGLPSKEPLAGPHHRLSKSRNEKLDLSITSLCRTFNIFGNPFEEQQTMELYNIITKHVMPEEVKNDVLRQEELGSQCFKDFVFNRIVSKSVNFWAPMKKCRMKLCSAMTKKARIQTEDVTVELREDRNLFARLLVASKSRDDLNLQDTIGNYELSVVPRSLFSQDGTLLHCQKSKLLSILEDLPVPELTQSNIPPGSPSCTVSIIDGMAELQALHKPDNIITMNQLADLYTNIILCKYVSEEIHVIFDRYDINSSLKSATRKKRQCDNYGVKYHINDTTNVAKTTMKKLLSTSQTKDALTCYLAENLLRNASERDIKLVVAWRSDCKTSFMDMSYLRSTHEEADTKLVLHAVDATSRGCTEINVYSPDTDVLILLIRRFPNLCSNTNFITSTGIKHRKISIRDMYTTLTDSTAKALPGFHALSGTDITGSFAGKGKLSFWKAFIKSDATIKNALTALGSSDSITDSLFDKLEEFVCRVYAPNTHIVQVSKLRWWYFSRKQAHSERLPPTKSSLRQGILRAHYQCIIWHNDSLPNPQIPSPDGFGWERCGDVWVPILMTELPAPKQVIATMKCCCAKSNCSTGRCGCRKAGLPCTDMCECSAFDFCENQSANEMSGDVLSETDSSDEEEP